MCKIIDLHHSCGQCAPKRIWRLCNLPWGEAARRHIMRHMSQKLIPYLTEAQSRHLGDKMRQLQSPSLEISVRATASCMRDGCTTSPKWPEHWGPAAHKLLRDWGHLDGVNDAKVQEHIGNVTFALANVGERGYKQNLYLQSPVWDLSCQRPHLMLHYCTG